MIPKSKIIYARLIFRNRYELSPEEQEEYISPAEIKNYFAERLAEEIKDMTLAEIATLVEIEIEEVGK